MQEQSLILLKPDTIHRSIVWKIITRLEKKWLKLVWNKMMQLNESILKEHYSHLTDKPFFPNIVSFMMETPVIAQVREWSEAVNVLRKLLWETNARDAAPWTIRWDYGISVWRNIMHASEDIYAAEKEVKRFFKDEEVFSYKKIDDTTIYEDNE